MRSAADRIRRQVRQTSLRHSAALSNRSGADVLLKLETEQPTGSFKVRGACNAIRVLLEAEPPEGVVTASTGNHARAVTYFGNKFGLPVRAFMASNVPPERLSALQEMGADTDTTSPDQTEAIVAATRFAEEHRYAFIPPFDHRDVISGQGTVGLELCAEAALDAVIVPVSGGGLIGGVGLAVRALRPGARIVGVCAERAPAMKRSLEAGHPVAVPEVTTVATSLMGDLGAQNRYTFRLAQRVVDEIGTVTDEQITAATDILRDEEGLDVEPSAAVGLAFLRQHAERLRGQRVAVIVTGSFV